MMGFETIERTPPRRAASAIPPEGVRVRTSRGMVVVHVGLRLAELLGVKAGDRIDLALGMGEDAGRVALLTPGAPESFKLGFYGRHRHALVLRVGARSREGVFAAEFPSFDRLQVPVARMADGRRRAVFTATPAMLDVEAGAAEAERAYAAALAERAA